MNFNKITNPTYALVNPVNVSSPNPQNSYIVDNTDLPEELISGLGTGQLFLEVDVQNHTPSIGGFIFALGVGNSTNNSLSVSKTGSLVWALRLRSSAGEEYIGSAPTLISDSSIRATFYVDLTAETYRTYINGRLSNSGTLNFAHNINNIIEELTLFDREDFQNRQFNGFIHSIKLFYLPAPLSDNNADQSALDLHDDGASSLLSGLKLWIEPDATDVAAAGVRNRAADTDTSLAFLSTAGLMTRKGSAKIQQIHGVNTRAFYNRGVTAGGAGHFRTASDSVFNPDNCIWESKTLPISISGTAKTIFGDDNNALDVITSGTNVVRFSTDIGVTTPTISPTIVTGETLYAAGIVGDLDGTRKQYAVANGVIGTGVATGVLDESGEVAIGAQGTTDANPFKGYTFGVRVLQFTSDANMPTLEEVKQIIAYHSNNWPNLHPIVQAKITDETCRVVEYNGDGLVEQTLDNWVWESVSTNTIVPSHDAGEKTGFTDNSMLVGDIKQSSVALYVGSPDGVDGDAGTLGIESNPYRTSSNIANAMSALLMEGSELVLGAYDYGSQEVVVSVSGRGNRKTLVSGDGVDCNVKAIDLGSANDVLVLGNGMHVIQATVDQNAISGAGSKQAIAGVVPRGATGTGGGINLTGDNCSVHNCVAPDNIGYGFSITGVDSIVTSNISTGSTNALIGHASTISDYNCWDGAIVTASAGEYDIENQTPLFSDLSANDFTLQLRSNLIHGGEWLPGYNTSWDIGAYPFYKMQGIDIGGLVAIKDFGQVLIV